MKNLIMLLITLMLLLSCKPKPEPELSYREQILNDPIHRLESYGDVSNGELSTKLDDCPDFILNWLMDWDEVNNYYNYTLSHEEKKIFEDSIDLLPATMRKQINENVVKIYFVENFRGGGLTNFIVGPDDELFCFMLFNPITFKRTISETITIKENTCFIQDDESYDVSFNISDKLNSFIYLLLHEGAHALCLGNKNYPILTPGTYPFEDPIRVTGTQFTRGLWSDYYQLRLKITNLIPSRVTFYEFEEGPKINISESERLYRDLSLTPFASLYSTKNWADDFADYVTCKFLVDYLDCDYEVVVSKDGKEIFSYEYFENELVARRYKGAITELFD